MRIALYGYGKMGKAIEMAAIDRGHEVVLRVGSENAGASPGGVDVAIEFSRPSEAVRNIELCLSHQVPIVVGTTGWYDAMNEVKRMIDRYQGSMLWASNFSLGVNIFFRVNRLLAAMMEKHRYAVHIDEIHHVHKLDAPSGTAITLARDIDLRNSRYSGWEPASSELTGKDDDPDRKGNGARDHFIGAQIGAEGPLPIPIPILSERTGEVPGKHAVTWNSPNDRIVITHEAFDRSGFAQGAVIAAEWLKGRKGIFTMDDILGA